MYRTIRADEIIRTAERLVARVRERFPDSGLAKVARARSEELSTDGELWLIGAEVAAN